MKLISALPILLVGFFSDSVLAGGKRSSSRSSSSSSSSSGEETITLRVTNLSVRQPMSPFFIMTHDDSIAPLFTFGSPSSEPLALLAENGDPGPLVELYEGEDGVGEAFVFARNPPYGGSVEGGGPNAFNIEIPYDSRYPYITIASMFINTNDCFLAINGMKLSRGDVLYLPGLDSGTEVNNELCNSIPGPACAGIDGGNERSGDGEGFVHVHQGFFGIGDLADGRYDWRNPMAQVIVM